jgi:malate dehydrogenase (oxaloacetate-decarboxylating)(NADP+)
MGHPKETFIQDKVTGNAAHGVDVLRDPAINKGTAFTDAERDALGLHGLLPPNVSTLDAQVGRVLENFRRKSTTLEKYIDLAGLHDRNWTLFYRC